MGHFGFEKYVGDVQRPVSRALHVAGGRLAALDRQVQVWALDQLMLVGGMWMRISFPYRESWYLLFFE
jgi:hypothetical protein